MFLSRGCRWIRLVRVSTSPLAISGSPLNRDRSTTGRASSTHSGRSTPSEQLQQHQWKSVYRDFLLHVHPDFFQDSTLATERAVNEKSLKAFSQHLDQLQLLGYDGVGSSRDLRSSSFSKGATSQLVFFLKQGGDPAHEAETDGSGDNSGSSPRKVILPLESHQQMATQIFELGITSTSIPPTLDDDPTTDHPDNSSSSSSRSSGTDGGDGGSNSDWHIWGDQLFGGSTANRAWDKAASARRRRQLHGRSAFSGDDDRSSEGRQRSTEWGAAFEKAGGDAFSRLGHVLATDGGRALVRERRASSRNVRQLVNELREEFGFGDFSFRCGWSKSNLCVALGSLLETCRVNRSVLRVRDFGGLEVTLRNDPSVLHKGEIRLCPADVPNQWMSVLQSVTPAVIAAAEERSREMSSLQEQASMALRGARLSRGLSCSKSRYRQFLEEVCESAKADPVIDDFQDSDGAATSVALGDWSALRCKVEEGYSRVSKVLEDGTIQVGSGMSLQTLRRCLGRDLASASAATAESLRLAAMASATADLCRHSLGLEDIDRARQATPTHSQMVIACEALIRFSERAKSGDLEAEALAARRRLRGHSVRVVGSSRVGVSDGVTEDGEIVVRWDWAEEAEAERRNPVSLFE